VEEFISLRDQIATSPQGGAAMAIVALLMYTEDAQLGRECLTVAVDRSRLQEGTQGYKGWQLRRRDMERTEAQLRDMPYLPRSYLEGASPDNGYQLPAAPYVLQFSDNPYSGAVESGEYKVFVACSGAARARPATVRRNDKGIWKAYEWSSLLVGVQPPEKETTDDL
jgi:hypothetical protein